MTAALGWVFLCLLGFCVNEILCQAAGDACILSGSKDAATCLPLSQCPSATSQLQLQKVRPQLCGFQGSAAEPIVCCPTPSHPESTHLVEVDDPSERSYGEKSRRKCREYQKYSKENTTNLLPNGPETVEVDKCPSYIFQLIVGGYNARIGEYPHVVLLGFEYSNGSTFFRCSGSLISEQFVLAPAHCLYDAETRSHVKKVRLGDLDSGSDEDDDIEIQDILVDQIYKHPDVKPSSAYNDIALLKLESPPKLSWKVKPACLHTQKDIGQTTPIVIDYEQDWTRPKKKEPLWATRVKIVSNLECNKSFPVNRRLSSGIKDTQLCTSGVNRRVPFMGVGRLLVIYNKDVECSFDIIGVASYGIGGAFDDQPGVYTRVYSYIEWIESIVWP